MWGTVAVFHSNALQPRIVWLVWALSYEPAGLDGIDLIPPHFPPQGDPVDAENLGGPCFVV
ncbi:hypothetical protein DSLASN_09080 [Desulfoluna limicola]|uniref:Uncharacterized protein n=1 Tax=Desulfoluna limicola TaxID=2810562 RepID=A0ABM7PDK7_9BACT|nr:hypothetical protein DSLASN_09080 [Desulfoluna limicola]